MTRLKKTDIFKDFLSDTLEDSGIMRICLKTNDLKEVISIAQKYRLDFDDAYQYVTAKKYKLVIVSLDSDFDRTDIGRKTPAQLLKE